jgi:hypothetical protein
MVSLLLAFRKEFLDSLVVNCKLSLKVMARIYTKPRNEAAKMMQNQNSAWGRRRRRR